MAHSQGLSALGPSRQISVKTALAIRLWSSTIRITQVFLSVFGSSRIKLWLRERTVDPNFFRSIAIDSGNKRIVLFFCSSAGEFEQVAPILSKAEARGYFPVIGFFSDSGPKFLRAANYTYPWFRVPVDNLSSWQQIFNLLKPNLTVVVRYELWPSFLFVARSYSRLVCVNASRNHRWSYWALFSRRLLFRFFSRIWVTSAEDARFFQKKLGISSHRLQVSGDTKFDQAFSRKELRKDKAEEIRAKLKRTVGDFPRLVVGSAWRDDVATALAAFHLQDSRSETARKRQLVIAPHQPTTRFVEWAKRVSEERGFRTVLFSQLTDEYSGGDVEVIIADGIGYLAELYASCHWALVGGAFHHQVHNVLEPAVWGLKTTFGPRFQTSPEACGLVKSELVQVVHSVGDLADWWGSEADAAESGQRILAYLKSRRGAVNRVASQIFD